MALLLKIKAGEVHIGGAGDFEIALGAEDDEDVAAEALDEAGFVGGDDTIELGFAEGFAEEGRGEDLRSLGENDAFARDGGSDEGDVFGKAGALDFFYGVNGGDAEDGGAAGFGLGDDAVELGEGDEGANGVVNEDEFDGGVEMGESVGDGLLASVAAVDDAGGAAEFGAGDGVLEPREIVGARGDNEFGDGGAGGEAAKSEDDEGHAVKLEKLLGLSGGHAGAEAGGGKDGGEARHGANRRAER